MNVFIALKGTHFVIFICGYGYKIACQYDDKYSKPYKGYRGENAVYKLTENLLEEQKEIKK